MADTSLRLPGRGKGSAGGNDGAGRLAGCLESDGNILPAGFGATGADADGNARAGSGRDRLVGIVIPSVGTET